MTRFATLLAAVAVVATSAPALAQSGAAEARMDAAQRRFDNELNLYRQAVEEYRNAARRGPGGYYDSRPGYQDEDWQSSYRPSNAPPRYLTRDDTIYYGSDNRAYCRRSDGTTGLVVGAALGGILGNVVDGGRRRTLGTLLGGAGGALLGRSIEQQQVRCQ
jgi:uncharacterized protein YcfJ